MSLISFPAPGTNPEPQGTGGRLFREGTPNKMGAYCAACGFLLDMGEGRSISGDTKHAQYWCADKVACDDRKANPDSGTAPRGSYWDAIDEMVKVGRMTVLNGWEAERQGLQDAMAAYPNLSPEDAIRTHYRVLHEARMRDMIEHPEKYPNWPPLS